MTPLNMNLSGGTRKALDTLAERLEMPLNEVVRESLSMWWWMARERSKGTRFLVQRGDVVTELELPALDRLANGPPIEEPPDLEASEPAALPPPGGPGMSPGEAEALIRHLGAPDGAERAMGEIGIAYRRAAGRLHPDVGGDPAQWARLDRAAQVLGL